MAFAERSRGYRRKRFHTPAPAAPLATDDVLKTIERLAELRQINILTEEEFAAKKAELLSRL